MDSSTRWEDALVHSQMKVKREHQTEGINSPITRWRRGVFLVSRLKDGPTALSEEGLQTGTAFELKELETQHWLELIDVKHRYGSNLKYYHRRWIEEDTTDNFFKWLDEGGGKDLSMEECSREQLDKECIVYLSTEQRLNYLVKIGKDGKLLWAKNNQPVDTSSGRWKDSGDGRGILPETAQDRPERVRRDSFETVSSFGSLDSEQENQAWHYADDSDGTKKHSFLRRYFTLSGLTNRLLKKTVSRNTWIYVTDRNFNLFVGIKETGSFQHSSFLGGAWVTSAGLISVKNGTLHTISPLSGHYRTTTKHFHQFLECMRERGVDMRKARVSKAEAALWCTEHIGRLKKKKVSAMKKSKQAVKEPFK